MIISRGESRAAGKGWRAAAITREHQMRSLRERGEKWSDLEGAKEGLSHHGALALSQKAERERTDFHFAPGLVGPGGQCARHKPDTLTPI